MSTRTEAAVGAVELADWLLDRPYVAHGREAGAVLGATTGGAAPAYVYPEIAGYYLTWLAFLRTVEPDRTARATVRIEAVTGWLARELAGPGGPRTRSYLDPAEEPPEEWRNDALFAFDLGMVLRGLIASVSATGMGGTTTAQHAAAEPPVAESSTARAAELLDRLRDQDGSWLSCRPLPGATAPPERWSTRPGPHLLKVAGGVLALTRPQDAPRLTEAARATLRRHAAALADRLPAMSHPALYALEGLLQAEAAGHTEYRAELERCYTRLSSHLAHGVLHEYAERPDSRIRSDVLAQLLRVGSVLASQGRLDADAVGELPYVAKALTERIDPAGALPFDSADDSDGAARSGAAGRGARAGLGNTWCAMFAHQALVFHGRAASGRPVPDQWIRLLV
ncbi:hypothetical protein [Streptomyces sp. NPDC058683]|uniref:hypothetical protein n=1 Tax=Streptomyces sp. NPDC058683 TaxID=3346597 RepID=UPI00365C12AC